MKKRSILFRLCSWGLKHLSIKEIALFHFEYERRLDAARRDWSIKTYEQDIYPQEKEPPNNFCPLCSCRIEINPNPLNNKNFIISPVTKPKKD